MDNVREDLREKAIKNYQDRLSDQKHKRSLDESCESLIVDIADKGEIRRRRLSGYIADIPFTRKVGYLFHKHCSSLVTQSIPQFLL